MLNNFKFDLQLFGDGDGAPSSSGEGQGAVSAVAGQNSSPTGGNGENTAVTEQTSVEDRLRKLGVPEDKIRRHIKLRGNKLAPAPVREDEGKGTPEGKTELEASESVKRLTFDEILADPEYNKSVQDIVKSRLREEKSKTVRELKEGRDAGQNLKAIDSALRLLAKGYGLDPEKLDYASLAKKIEDDDRYISESAVEMGLDDEAARRFTKIERENERLRQAESQRQEAETLRLAGQRNIEHIRSLETQGEKLREVFPNFDLREELKNPVFARMTSPSGGISVEDAYYAVHRREIQEASVKATAKKTAEKLANSIASGQTRPNESGTSSQATSVTSFDFKNASVAERNAIKEKMRLAAAQGKRLYPGGIIK